MAALAHVFDQSMYTFVSQGYSNVGPKKKNKTDGDLHTTVPSSCKVGEGGCCDSIFHDTFPSAVIEMLPRDVVMYKRSSRNTMQACLLPVMICNIPNTVYECIYMCMFFL